MNHGFSYESDNIILRPLSADDSELFRQLRNRDEVRKWFIHSDIISAEDQRVWYGKYLERKDDYMFSVYYRDEDGQVYFIGGVAIYNVDNERKEAEFGRIIIDKDHTHKKGLGVSALNALCHIAHRDLGLYSLYLKVLRTNPPAIKTYERAGFKPIEPPYPGERTDIEDQLIYMRRMV